MLDKYSMDKKEISYVRIFSSQKLWLSVFHAFKETLLKLLLIYTLKRKTIQIARSFSEFSVK